MARTATSVEAELDAVRDRKAALTNTAITEMSGDIRSKHEQGIAALNRHEEKLVIELNALNSYVSADDNGDW